MGMKELLRTNDITIIAFAKALLQGEDIEVFEFDVNMSADSTRQCNMLVISYE